MNVLLLGGSKNIGYHAGQRLLASGATVTFLLRKQTVFDKDDSMKPYMASGHIKIVPGDALKEDDVKAAWEAAGENGPVDLLLFTVGGTGTISITKGIILEVPNLCTAAMLNVLATMPLTTPQPKLIFVSSAGLTKEAHEHLPCPLKPMYNYLLTGPHNDKLGMERIVSHAAGWQWPTNEPEPKEDILPPGWQARLPGDFGYLKQALAVRPAVLTNGECRADGGKKTYRAADTDLTGYTISRRDVAHFIVEDALKNWEKWGNKCARVTY